MIFNKRTPITNPPQIITPNASKTDRKLYIGNLPFGITPPTVSRLI